MTRVRAAFAIVPVCLVLASCGSNGANGQAAKRVATTETTLQQSAPSPSSTATSKPASSSPSPTGWTFVSLASKFQALPTGHDDTRLYAPSCPTANWCMVHSGAHYVIYNKGHFGKLLQLESPSDASLGYGVQDDLSCSSPRFCMAFDGRYMVFDGNKWSRASSGGANSGVGGLVCPADQLCFAETSSSIQEYDNGNWKSEGSQDPALVDGPIRCSSRQFCVATDNAGNALIWNGNAWSGPIHVPHQTSFDLNVICVPQSSCFIGSGPGSTTVQVSPTGTLDAVASTNSLLAGQTYKSVSCGSRSFCLSLDALRPQDFLIFDNGHWSTPKGTFDLAYVDSIACAASGVCLATGTTPTDNFEVGIYNANHN